METNRLKWIVPLAWLFLLAGCAIGFDGPLPPPTDTPAAPAPGSPRPAAESAQPLALPTPGAVIVDNADPGFAIEAGEWGKCAGSDCDGTPYAADFRYAEPGCIDCRARYDLQVPATSNYDVWAWWPQGEDRATDTPYTISCTGGPVIINVDQRNNGSDWYRLATLPFAEGPASIFVAGATTGYANADAVALTPEGSGPPAGLYSGAAPEIEYLLAETSANVGCYTLRWQVSNATAVYLDGELVDNPGTREVCPTDATVYTLRAENALAATELTVTVGSGGTVVPTPSATAFPVIPTPPPAAAGAIVIDHTCTDISKIPDYWLEQAKRLTVHYAHTSHGSQIVTGLEWLAAQDSRYAATVRYCGDDAGLPEEGGVLRLCDGNPAEDYIEPNDYWSTEDGLNRTRAVAGTGLFNFSMWSWCGEQSENDVATLQQYLGTLDQLEGEFPAMRFIYMTGHTDGGSDTLTRNNDLVRQYVRDNGKVLFDFADIEMYDPAGNYYADTDDSCPWCEAWCEDYPQDCVNLDQMGDCAHTHSLQCRLKAQAFWWLMARLAGWDGRP